MIALLIPAILLGWLVFALDHAPEGYQDENGFHFGRPPKFQTHQDPRSKARRGALLTPDKRQLEMKARRAKPLPKRG